MYNILQVPFQDFQCFLSGYESRQGIVCLVSSFVSSLCLNQSLDQLGQILPKVPNLLAIRSGQAYYCLITAFFTPRDPTKGANDASVGSRDEIFHMNHRHPRNCHTGWLSVMRWRWYQNYQAFDVDYNCHWGLAQCAYILMIYCTAVSSIETLFVMAPGHGVRSQYCLTGLVPQTRP